MARKTTTQKTTQANIGAYRHTAAKRKNNPPAKIAAEGSVPLIAKAEYSYSPRRAPALQFDPAGQAEKLLAAARQGKLDDEQIALLAVLLGADEPWLEWAGKREAGQTFAVDPVALHIHERISAQAILKIAARQDVQRSLFADPEQQYHEAVQFYQHDIDWTNRMILGDSLQVMSSLARREDLAGKVQMIYLDPPYGIKFASNFQPEIGKRDVKDKEQDLTREPEMVKAYRDTWQLGVHSYLSYLRERLVVARELLADSGSIFVQIGEENLHRVRGVMDETFGADNLVTVIVVKKKANQKGDLLESINDYILFYAKDRQQVKYRHLFEDKSEADDEAEFSSDLTGGGVFRTQIFEFEFDDQRYRPASGNSWKTSLVGMNRLKRAERIRSAKSVIRYRRFKSDFGYSTLTNMWEDTGGASDRVYVVQTAAKVIRRCLLMTTAPGDLVLDPTCGSGTTAHVAEQWGRRWITIDTSRVALAIARQRLLTAKFDYYKLRDEEQGVAGNFKYKTVPHITLKSIAQNANLDPIFARHEPILAEKLAAGNASLAQVSDALRTKLQRKLIEKQRAAGKKAITDADRSRWELPKRGAQWQHGQLPFDADPDYPGALSEAVTAYRQAWRAKMDEVNACIAANAEPEELVDQPEISKGIVRVSGPFTVEAVQPPEMSLGEVIYRGEGMFEGEPEELAGTFAGSGATSAPRRSGALEVRMVEPRSEHEAQNLAAYLEQMLQRLRASGVSFLNNKQMRFTRLDALAGNASGLHVEGRWVSAGEQDDDADGQATVCVAFGPQYGPVTAKQVEELIRAANRRGYDDLIVAGFSFDGPAQTAIAEAQHPRLRIHVAHISPDVNPGMNGLLKEQRDSQLFTVFGQPRTRLDGADGSGEYTITMEGVDIYNPVDNSITPTGADKVAAWFVDSDYDGWTFCITQAFFPDRTAWEKLSRALNGVVETAFEALSGTKSLPFPPGKHRCVAVKVIDPRGNEVMCVHKLG